MSVGLGGLVFLIFLFLKLAGIGVVATWSWIWVTSPLWIGFALWIVVLAILGIIAAAFAVVEKAWRR